MKETRICEEIRTEVRCGVFTNGAYRALLAENGLYRFSSFLAIPVESVVKNVRPDRRTLKVRLSHDGRPLSAYLKVSNYSWPGSLFAALRKFTRQRGSLVHEYRNLLRMREIGVPSITPIAAATRTRWLRRESFLLTEDLGPTRKLEEYVPEVFDRPWRAEQAVRKRQLAAALAHLARRMHDGGVNHRDFYLSHIHILPLGEPWPRLFIIDLNRADRRRRVGGRWKVKDLAALNYSAPASVFSRTDRLRFLKLYLGTGKLDRPQRRLVARILGKTAGIARHAARSKERDLRYAADARAGGPGSEGMRR